MKKTSTVTTVRLRPTVLKMLNVFVKKGMSKSNIINEAVRTYLLRKEFEEIRARLVPQARARGIYTDEDVEKTLS